MTSHGIKSTLPSFANHPASTVWQARRARHLSVLELSKRSGVNEATIRTCERKALLPDEADLAKLAHALTVKVAVLLGQAELCPLPTETRQVSPAELRRFKAHTRRIQRLFPAVRVNQQTANPYYP